VKKGFWIPIFTSFFLTVEIIQAVQVLYTEFSIACAS
jgi:hypothetical protein